MQVDVFPLKSSQSNRVKPSLLRGYQSHLGSFVSGGVGFNATLCKCCINAFLYVLGWEYDVFVSFVLQEKKKQECDFFLQIK